MNISRAQKHPPESGLAMVCPSCGARGTFEFVLSPSELPDVQPVYNHPRRVGLRQCPNGACRELVLLVFEGHTIYESYPAPGLPFNKEGIPHAIANCLEEASRCYANRCFTAAAMLIRKTLEFLCEDRQCKGDSLADRLKALRSTVIVPQELLDGADDLRLLGNDATHIKAKAFDDIDRNLVEIAFEFTMELMRAVYQYKGLLKKWQSLKQTVVT